MNETKTETMRPATPPLLLGHTYPPIDAAGSSLAMFTFGAQMRSFGAVLSVLAVGDLRFRSG